MSHSQFHSTNLFILRHAWLNLWDKHMTTGRINQVTTFQVQRQAGWTLQRPILLQLGKFAFSWAGVHWRWSIGLCCFVTFSGVHSKSSHKPKLPYPPISQSFRPTSLCCAGLDLQQAKIMAFKENYQRATGSVHMGIAQSWRILKWLFEMLQNAPVWLSARQPTLLLNHIVENDST